MTAPDPSGRNDAATQGGGAQTWRVVLERPATGERRTVALDLVADACFCDARPCECGGRWIATCPDSPLSRGQGDSPRHAALMCVAEAWPWVATEGWPWAPVEILAPGEPSRAVAEEREACAAVCDEIEHELKVEAMLEREDGDGDEAAASDEQAVGASACAAAIRARGGAQ